MEKNIVGIIAIVVGCAIIIFNKGFVRSSLEFQNKTFGFHFGKKEAEAGNRSAPVIGLVFIAMGVLVLFDVIKLK